MSNLKSLHDDRYEEFEFFMKTQRDFNHNIESQILTNCIEISECAIELKDLEQKCKNGIYSPSKAYKHRSLFVTRYMYDAKILSRERMPVQNF